LILLTWVVISCPLSSIFNCIKPGFVSRAINLYYQ
jgi:hypothetical protein